MASSPPQGPPPAAALAGELQAARLRVLQLECILEAKEREMQLVRQHVGDQVGRRADGAPYRLYRLCPVHGNPTGW